MLALHNLQKNKKAVRQSKRLGRGNASGRGNYSTKGIKGQRARAGGRAGLAARSIKSYMLRIPKSRGFKSDKPKTAIITTDQLEKKFEDGSRITQVTMLKAGLVPSIRFGVKVLSRGKISKKLMVQAKAFSKEAARQIIKAGGSVTSLGETKDKKTD